MDLPRKQTYLSSYKTFVDRHCRCQRHRYPYRQATFVNPDVIRAQMEGGAGYGLGALLRNEITFAKGQVEQSNFDNYLPLRISDMPEIDVEIVMSNETPSGVGEPSDLPWPMRFLLSQENVFWNFR